MGFFPAGYAPLQRKLSSRNGPRERAPAKSTLFLDITGINGISSETQGYSGDKKSWDIHREGAREREREERHGAALNYSFTISTFLRATTPSLLPPRCFHLPRKKKTQVRELHYARIVAEPD